MIDTRNKRASIISLGLASLLVLPVPDATLDSADRLHLAYSYATEAAAPTVDSGALVLVGDAVVTSIALGADSIPDTTIAVGDEAVTAVSIGDNLVTS